MPGRGAAGSYLTAQRNKDTRFRSHFPAVNLGGFYRPQLTPHLGFNPGELGAELGAGPASGLLSLALSQRAAGGARELGEDVGRLVANAASSKSSPALAWLFFP